MGAVYKARDRELDRLVAIKVIRPELANDPDILKRFKQELILARQVTHKNVVRIFDLGEAEGFKFITMEYVEGQDLKSILAERGKLAPDEAARIITQVCCALEAAHTEGVVHRDLKPQNIMLDSQGKVLVMDFGIARSMESSGLTQTGALVGTPEYMSPEQAKGEEVDARSDLFTLGIIFYQLLTGKVPFQANTTVATLLKRTQERAAPPVKEDPSIPRFLSDVVVKCLETESRHRYQHAREILRDLEARRGRRTRTLRLPRFRTVEEFPTRWVAPGLAALLLLIFVIVFRGRIFERPSQQKPAQPKTVTVLVADFTNHTGDPIFDDTLEPMVNVALEGASFISAYNRGTARKLANLAHPTDKLDERAARLVAVSRGVSAVVTGSLDSRGQGYRLSLEAIDAVTGKTLASAGVTARNKDEVLFDVPKVAAPIRKALGDTTPESVQLAATQGSFATSNLEAVHQFGIGVAQQFAGNMQGALQSFSKAAELDPNFARAYAGMAASSRNLGNAQDAEKYAKLAMEHVDRMTERERYRIRGLYYIATEKWQNCVEEYSELLKQYPADNIGHLNLAMCFGYLYNFPRALEEARRAVELAPKDLMARVNFSLTACFTGDFQTCERGGREVQRLNPSYDEGYLVQAYAQQGQSQMAQADETYRELEKLGVVGASEAASGLANLALYEGRYRQAVEILERAVAADVAAKEPDQAADHLAMLAYAELLRGEKQSALAAAEKALAYSQSAKIRFLVARAFLEGGESARARKLASALGSGLEAKPQAYAKLILAEAALKDHRPKEALQLLTEAKNLADMWIVHLDLGLTYLEAGAFAEADSEFDRCMKRRGEALELFIDDMPTYSYLPPAYYYQGRALEGLKSPGAADSYRTYLGIRGKAGEDPLLPEIRRRLGQLGARPPG